MKIGSATYGRLVTKHVRTLAPASCTGRPYRDEEAMRMTRRLSDHTPYGQNQWMTSVRIAAALLLFFGVGSEGTAIAGGNIQATSIAYQTGTITAIYENTFQIDGKTYVLTPDAVILDDSGNPTDTEAMAVGIEVKYHVKKDKSDKIDNIILFLPR